MKTRAAVPALIFLAVALAGCTASVPAVTPTVIASSTVEAQSEPPVSPSSDPASATPQLCLDYEPPAASDEDGGAIAAVVATAELPKDVVLNPGVQTIQSVESPGMFETVVRICSTPMGEDRLKEIASTVAVSLAGSPAADSLSVLVVSAWTPGAGDYLEQVESVSTEFQLYTWDEVAAVPLASNWE